MKINLKLAIAVLASLILLSFNCNNANAQLGLRVDGGVVDFKAVQLSPFATENFYTYVSWSEWIHEHFLNLPVHFKWNFEIRSLYRFFPLFCRRYGLLNELP